MGERLQAAASRDHTQWSAIGALLPAVGVTCALFLPRSSASGALLPLIFVLSGALIGRWWASLPSLGVIVLLNLAELAGIHNPGAIALHGEFDLGFFLATSFGATILALVGVGIRITVSALLHRGRPGRTE